MRDESVIKVDEIDQEFLKRLEDMEIFTGEDFLNADTIENLDPEKKEILDHKIRDYVEALEKGDFRHFTYLPPREHWRIYKSVKDAGKLLYLDIETTGRQIFHDEITVVGFYDGKEYKYLVSGIDLTSENLDKALSGYDMIVTHSGMIFDIPFLEYKFPDVNYDLLHFDLSFACRKLELPDKFGDLLGHLELDPGKRNRKFTGVKAVQLWGEYKKGSPAALDLILEKNKSEVTLMEKVADIIFDMMQQYSRELEEETPGDEDVREITETIDKQETPTEKEKEVEIMEMTEVSMEDEKSLIEKEGISSKDAPEAIGPYSPAIKCNGMLFISGQLPMEPDTGRLVGGGFGIKTKRAMDNVGAILQQAGMDYNNLVKVTIYTTQMDKFHQINEAYAGYFTENPPARAVVGVSELPRGAEIEIEAIAMQGN